MQRLQNYITKLNNDGYCIIKNILSKNNCKNIIKKLKKIYNYRVRNSLSAGSNGNQCLYNFFYEDLKLIKLIDIKIIDKILSMVLDKNYVLQSTNAQNRILETRPKANSRGNFKIGNEWHVDSRVINKDKKIGNGISYLVIIALEDFKNNNSATKFVPNSFKFKKIPKRHGVYKHKKLIMKQGSICIMDTATWHKGGEPSKNSRWSIFSIYTPWFIKPYFNYEKLIKNAKLLTKNQKKLLHFYSAPPESHNDRLHTIIKY